MCARHDFTIGEHMVQVEPHKAPGSETLLLYLTILNPAEGVEEWKGVVRMAGGPDWAVLTYGGTPLDLGGLDRTLESS